MKAQERPKIMEIETIQLKSGLDDSRSKIIQPEQNLTLSGKKVDDLTTNVPAWREKEEALQEQLAAAEFRVKIAEEKFNMQTELLQKEIRMRAMKDDELNDGRATFDKQEIDVTHLSKKLQDLERQSKSSHGKFEDQEKLVKLKPEIFLNEIKGTSKFDEKLSGIAEPRTNQVVHIITTLQEDPSGFPGSSFPGEQTHDVVKQVKTNVYMPQKELNQSQEQISELESCLNSVEVCMDSKDKLAAVELELKSALLREIDHQNKLRVYEEQLMVKESIINQTTIRCMELEELLESQAKETEMKFQEAKEAFMSAVTAAKRLHEKLRPLEMQGNQSENEAEQTTSSAAGNQVNGLVGKMHDTARSFLYFRNKTNRMLEDQNVFAHDARTSQRQSYFQPLGFSLNFVLGVALLSIVIGFVIGKH
ncbi:hypothetical protein SUGI_0522300 [Cryptomeria japonica]|uniref:uncharacterized protein LOC131063634 n=1 Tax=Cryptomeria japonica TaxID=3369 RepID=UPI002408D676|nr:uncharacterized protein LOC131063634 [Cryptomeria japonica]XP_057853514.2 uncharacterized protein LOC131063634 [Cryptomeria japonica]GLJ26784.1 hypothetical protein SUGI_0522300 [Cryptomeria japonica]